MDGRCIANIRNGASQTGCVDPQAGLGQFPQFFEAHAPRLKINRVIDNQRAARLIDMETAHTVAVVGQYMRVLEVAQIVRTLPHLDALREAGYQLAQARCLALQPVGVMQHHAYPAQAIPLQEIGENFEAGLFFETQCGQIAIEYQNLVLRQAQHRIAGLAILGFTGQ